MCASTRAISALNASMRLCSSSIDMGSRSCLPSSTSGSPGLLGNSSSRSIVKSLTVHALKSISRRVADLPSSMRAIVADGDGGLALVDRPVPRPGRGEVLIKVAAAGVNRPDVLQRRGMYPPPPGAPDILGLEIAGEVVEEGDDVPPLMG